MREQKLYFIVFYIQMHMVQWLSTSTLALILIAHMPTKRIQSPYIFCIYIKQTTSIFLVFCFVESLKDFFDFSWSEATYCSQSLKKTNKTNKHRTSTIKKKTFLPLRRQSNYCSVCFQQTSHTKSRRIGLFNQGEWLAVLVEWLAFPWNLISYYQRHHLLMFSELLVSAGQKILYAMKKNVWKLDWGTCRHFMFLHNTQDFDTRGFYWIDCIVFSILDGL